MIYLYLLLLALAVFALYLTLEDVAHQKLDQDED